MNTSPQAAASSNTATAPLSLGPTTLRTLVTDAARRCESSETIDLQGIQWLEHINLVVGSKSLAEYFYLNVLGCTRDDGKSFHVNLGQQQFHLAEAKAGEQQAQHFAGGSIGLVVPDLNTLRDRVTAAAAFDTRLKETQFALLSDDDDNSNDDDCVVLRGPWGNIFHIYSTQDDAKLSHLKQQQQPLSASSMKMVTMHAEGGGYGSHRMAVRGKPGIRYVEIPFPKGKSDALATFYRTVIGCNVWQTRSSSSSSSHNNNNDEERNCVVVEVGPGVHLVYVEHCDEQIPAESIQAMEGIHICVYVNDFAALYQRLSNRQLIWTNPRFLHLDSCDTWAEALASRTLRFKDIVDVSTGEVILQLEHETRPLRHGQYLKVPKYEPV